MNTIAIAKSQRSFIECPWTAAIGAAQAAQTVSKDRSFHPVRKYLDSIAWDGVNRLDTWLERYLGAQDSNYARAVGARWLISAVARIYRPGVKADCCLILEGPQGSKKSTALKPWQGHTSLTNWRTWHQESVLQTQGVWIIELSELDSLTRAEVGRIKAFEPDHRPGSDRLTANV